ncbi:MAG: iron complex outermembrane recepter protein [Bacteroidetes bacterium]|nr:MAG: iron complex outermembrane recepter protein [Bacteroidota bacterium]
MKHPFLLFLLFITAGHIPLHGQNMLSGTISDSEEHHGIRGAAVIVHDLKRGVLTDSLGYYYITNLPAGSFLIEVRCTGYSPQTKVISISGKSKLDVELHHAATEINEVTITGTTGATQRLLNPVPVATMRIEELRQSATTNITAAISALPGVSQISTGASIGKPVIRGLGYNRVLVLNDGIRQEGQQWGDEHGVEIDANSVEQVEIIKGPGSLMYGSDALAGVVNFISTNSAQPGTVTGNLSGEYQSNSRLYGWSALNQGNLDGFNWLLRASQKSAGNFTNATDGRVYNSGFSEFNVNGYAGVNKKWGYTYLRFSSFHQQPGLVEGERDSLGNFIKLVAINDSTVEEVAATQTDLDKRETDIPRQDVRHLRIQSDSKFFIGQHKLSFSAAYQQNTRKEFADPLNPEATELEFLLQTANYDLRWTKSIFGTWETSAGANGMYQQNTNAGEEQLIPDYSLFDAGAYLVTQRIAGRWFFSAGLRFDQRRLRGESLWLDSLDQPTTEPELLSSVKFHALERNFNSPSASLGLSFKITSRLIAKLNGALGFRAPNLAELASNGVHEGAFRYEYGNENLRAESGRQLDAGFIFDGRHISLELDGFAGTIRDFIFLQKLRSANGGDSIPDPSDPAPAFSYVQGNAKRFGGEISFDLHPHPLDWLHFENSFALVMASLADQADSMTTIPFTPAPRYRAELRAHFEKSGKYFRNLFLKFETDHAFAQNNFYSAFGTETATAAYTLLHAGAGTDIVTAKGKNCFTILFSVNNIKDAMYQDHLSRLKYAPENPLNGKRGIYGPGRNFTVKIFVPLTFKKAPVKKAGEDDLEGIIIEQH